jgi:mannosyl-3-phosphoglycerate phosphatase
MTAGEIASLTGLSETEAKQARAREFTEPFLIEHDSDLPKIKHMAESRGLAVTRGGRFYHLVKAGQSKGNAVKIVADFYKNEMKTVDLLTVGIGDSENDLSMLAQVDIPVLIPRPRRGFLDIDLPGLLRAPEPGARGWNSVVEAILDRMA